MGFSSAKDTAGRPAKRLTLFSNKCWNVYFPNDAIVCIKLKLPKKYLKYVKYKDTSAVLLFLKKHDGLIHYSPNLLTKLKRQDNIKKEVNYSSNS